MTDSSPDLWSDDWSDDYVLEQVRNAPDLPEAGHPPCRKVLCKDTVVKISVLGSYGPEARMLHFVGSQTTIPVPKVRRYISNSNDTSDYLILEKIDGQPMDQIWDNLSDQSKEKIATTLSNYVLQLRTASPSYRYCTVPGPMADTPQECEGSWALFGERPRGPFQDASALMKFINEIYPKPFDPSPSLVLTHGSLNMHNIIQGHDGKLWVTNWELSGLYPSWFEFVAMHHAAEDDKAPMSWQRFVPEVTAPLLVDQKILGLKYECMPM